MKNPLRKYLDLHGLAANDFAKKSGLSIFQVSRLVNDRVSPTVGVLHTLRKATNGEVRPDDWVNWVFR